MEDEPKFDDQELNEIEEAIREMPQEELEEALKRIREKQRKEIQ